MQLPGLFRIYCRRVIFLAQVFPEVEQLQSFILKGLNQFPVPLAYDAAGSGSPGMIEYGNRFA